MTEYFAQFGELFPAALTEEHRSLTQRLAGS